MPTLQIDKIKSSGLTHPTVYAHMSRLEKNESVEIIVHNLGDNMFSVGVTKSTHLPDDHYLFEESILMLNAKQALELRNALSHELRKG